jgi:enoyl-[acyl-carrier protein] reductase I
VIDLGGRTLFVFGVASEASIAWGIAKGLAAAGARLVLGYQARFRSRVVPLAGNLPAVGDLIPIDVADDETVRAFFAEFAARHPGDKAAGLVHAVAYAPPETFDRASLFASQEAIDATLAVGAHSLQRVVRHALPHLSPGSAIVTLTYLASQRWVPHYHVMAIAKAALECWVRELAAELGPDGHRVNAISAGPIATLAAAGIPGFERLLAHVRQHAPLRRNVSQEDIAGAALWLLSDLAGGVTGQTIYVDCGYSTVAVADTAAPELEPATPAVGATAAVGAAGAAQAIGTAVGAGVAGAEQA